MSANLKVTKSNDLIDASYDLSAQAQKLLLACLARLDPRKDIPETVEIHASDFSKLMNVDQKNAHREMYKAADSLFGASIILFDSETNEEIELRWIQKKAKKIKGEGKVCLTWSNDVLKYIGNLRQRFTSYEIKNIADMQSSYSIRVYEMLVRFMKTGQRKISVNEFREALCLGDRYPEFRFLKRDVIKVALKEINASSDIKADINYIKSGRKIVSLEFIFSTKKQMSLPLDSSVNTMTKSEFEKFARLGESLNDAVQRAKREGYKLTFNPFK